jgi:hypothetical protein
MNMIIDQEMPFWFEEQEVWVVKETEAWVVCVVPMIFNDRLAIADKSEFGRSWSAGWCYDKQPQALLAQVAALSWNPMENWTPVGFKKIAFDMRDMSHLDLDERQYVCAWCAGDLRLWERHPETPRAAEAEICAQCGAMRDNGGWFDGYGQALRYPTGKVKPDAGPSGLLPVRQGNRDEQ